MSFKDTVLTVVVNESGNKYGILKNSLRKFNDCIFFGMHPSTRTEMLQAVKSVIPFKYYLDEFRIYNTAMTADELIKNRFDVNYRENELFAGYDFDDATPKRFYDKSTNDFWPRNYGGIKRVIDTTRPFGNPPRKITKIEKGNTVFERNKRGFLKLNRNIFPAKTSFAFQCDFYMGIATSGKFSVLFPMPFFVNRSGLDIRFSFDSDSVFFGVLNSYKSTYITRNYDYKISNRWKKLTLCYDALKNEYNVYMGSTLIFTFSDMDLQDITQNYMGISFAAANYYGSPRFTTTVSMIDNIKLFSRPLNTGEILSPSDDGLLAYWTFEKTDGELAYDEISNLPLIMWEEYNLRKEEIVYSK
jgi:hypothetical protein